MAELKPYYVGKDTLKKACEDMIDFAYTQEPTSIELTVRASLDAVATYTLKLDGNITRRGELNG